MATYGPYPSCNILLLTLSPNTDSLAKEWPTRRGNILPIYPLDIPESKFPEPTLDFLMIMPKRKPRGKSIPGCMKCPLKIISLKSRIVAPEDRIEKNIA